VVDGARANGFAEWRLARATNNAVDENGSTKQGLKDAVSDPKVWALVLLQAYQLSSQTWTYIFPVREFIDLTMSIY
jgi:EamA domain-containing membrane protein RarD